METALVDYKTKLEQSSASLEQLRLADASVAGDAHAADADDLLALAARLFHTVDKNSDGSLSRAELIKAARGDIELRELLGLPARIGDEDRAAFERVFQGMDADDSRGVVFAEFRSWFVENAHVWAGSNSEGAQLVNLKLCKQAFELQREIALGDLTPKVMDDYVQRFAGFFAPSIEAAVNPKLPGPSAEGDFEAVTGLLQQVWHGFKNTEVSNLSFAFSGRDTVVVNQLYSNHLPDAPEEVKHDTKNDDLRVVQKLTF
eukprot:SAG31_NODE_14998_length_776_cov_1.412112_1_plen_258_part_11